MSEEKKLGPGPQAEMEATEKLPELNETALGDAALEDTASTEVLAVGADAKEEEDSGKKVWSRSKKEAAAGEAKGSGKARVAVKKSHSAKGQAEGSFKDRMWTPWLRPVVVLVAICFVTSLLLGLTNTLTTPYIEQNSKAAADAARKEVLPQATGFEDITPDPLPSNITSVYKATNGTGYVIQAYGKGYNGEVPAMVGFDMEGNITGVKFLDNNETPGLGQNLKTKPGFAAQFTGMPAGEEISAADIDTDALAGATLSTNGALAAVNAARSYYLELTGGTVRYDVPEDVMQQLFPNATTWEALDVTAPGTAGAWRGDDGTYVIVGQAAGMGSKPVSVAVAMDENGVILGLWADTSGETEGLGDHIGENQSFMGQFVDKTDTSGVDTVANATITSDAVVAAVDAALAALPLAKEA